MRARNKRNNIKGKKNKLRMKCHHIFRNTGLTLRKDIYIYYANANEARLRMTHAISLTASPTRSRIVVMHNGE